MMRKNRANSDVARHPSGHDMPSDGDSESQSVQVQA